MPQAPARTDLADGKHFYMVRPDGMTVEVIDTSDLSIASTITVESGPSTVAVCRKPQAALARALKA